MPTVNYVKMYRAGLLNEFYSKKNDSTISIKKYDLQLKVLEKLNIKDQHEASAVAEIVDSLFFFGSN